MGLLYLVIAIAVGAFIIFVGAWLAEVMTIQMYGFGIVVDKMERWEQLNSTKNAATSDEKKAKTAMKTAYGQFGSPKANQEWKCVCGYKNKKFATSCDNCGAPHP